MRLEWVALLQIFEKLPGLDIKYTVRATCSSWCWIHVDRRVKKKKQMEMRGNRKGTLNLLKRTAIPWAIKKGTNPDQLSHTWDGYVNKAGFSVLHQPTCCQPINDNSWAQKKCSRHFEWEFQKIIIFHLHYHPQLSNKKGQACKAEHWLLRTTRAFLYNPGASSRTVKMDQVQ